MNSPMQKEEIRIRETLSKQLKERNLSISSAARQAGISKGTVHNYANGVIPKSISNLKALADLFDISLVELILGKTASQSHPTSSEFEGRYEVVVKRIGSKKKEISITK